MERKVGILGGLEGGKTVIRITDYWEKKSVFNKSIKQAKVLEISVRNKDKFQTRVEVSHKMVSRCILKEIPISGLAWEILTILPSPAC